MTEMDLVRACIQYINARGGLAVRVNSGVIPVQDANGRRVVRGAPAGTSDILGCWQGRFLAVECKIGRNKPTRFQAEFIERVREAGGVGLVVWSLGELIENLEVE